MNSIEFIRKVLDKIAQQFPHATLKYEFHEYSATHFIAVSPEDLFEEVSFNNLIAEVYLQFIELNDPTDLAIIEDNGLTQLKCPTIVKLPATQKQRFVHSQQPADILPFTIPTKEFEIPWNITFLTANISTNLATPEIDWYNETIPYFANDLLSSVNPTAAAPMPFRHRTPIETEFLKAA